MAALATRVGKIRQASATLCYPLLLLSLLTGCTVDNGTVSMKLSENDWRTRVVVAEERQAEALERMALVLEEGYK